ncbi:hypothetical protein P154DRAFT_609026 [Amniculicola lignicola CBS 123094]|uniref:Gfo/Idh/MocA-like oxidoreductase C-terminal domain-containing protein n=1 Tax=Amniculicola lignicola CBS 123094 TaxID=1392246 RepID=A0A6A5W688_9PLEO|nr:hypothetical protein P154DRAFT_609026 [Amniculicola lignicola CBS 123094]
MHGRDKHFHGSGTSFADGKHRKVNPELAGGALLDLGVYSLSSCFHVAIMPGCWIHSPELASCLTPYHTGFDETTTILLTFFENTPSSRELQTIATSSIGESLRGLCVRVQGEWGELQVFPPAYQPTRNRRMYQMEMSRTNSGNILDL